MAALLMDADWSVELGADDPALEFPWSSSDGSQRYVDLAAHPQAVSEIAEAVEYPQLAEFLRTVNGPSRPWMTAKCDVWTDDELGEAEAIYGAALKFCSYVDLIASDHSARFSFEWHEAWVKSAAHKLDRDDAEAVACEFTVRRCWYHPKPVGKKSDPSSNLAEDESNLGFYVTLYVFGYGRDQAEARSRWAQGLRRVTDVIADLAV